MTKEKAILYIYGSGGNRSEMQRLFHHIDKELVVDSNIKHISIYDNGDILNCINYGYEMPIIRDKYSRFKTFKNILTNPYKIISILFELKSKYNVRVILSTGPGISILPVIFFKFFNSTKTIHIETECMFTRKTLSGNILHYLVDKFYVPNKQLLKIYKNSIYSGQL